ncbi:glycoside hydrolase family 16 protein [Pseudonocardia sp. RS11V-5]|uniref:glycoside hydrolase family 16 protein n=1 Tax=Pseudonocardia terrae TaxID=2905831 RepID=UPI001E50F3C3|nr:glycoside hydrolase family 16 protein [Pseudonocardia terrae]MCE3555513.1 glycoside hydrolase family 16 protein [Pseudonocardia terrae]
MALTVTAVAAAAALSVAAASFPATTAGAANGTEDCSWRLAAKVLYQELSIETSNRAQNLRQILADAGASDPAFVPADCTGRTDTSGTRDIGGSENSSTGTSGGGSSRSGALPGTTPTGGTGSASRDGNCSTTAAEKFGWGMPNRSDDFDSESSKGDWGLYDGQGHAGNGTRSPTAISVLNGLLTITGDTSGQSGGMAWNPGQKYGRWEGCVRSPAGSNDLHSLLLLWPDAENWPKGGEVDFMEISDPARQSIDGFLHYGADNSQEKASVDVDASQWHAFAVEWTADHIAYYVDGKQWFETTDKSHLPPGPMHLTIQLDNFGHPDRETQEHVDWVRQFSADGSTTPSDAFSGGSDASRSSRTGHSDSRRDRTRRSGSDGGRSDSHSSSSDS